MRRTLLLFSLLLLTTSMAFCQDELDQYITRMKKLKESGGSETAFMSAGSDFLYGQDYYDGRKYDMAANYFMEACRKDSLNAFYNYQVAASLYKQNDSHKAQQAQIYLARALQLNPGLRSRASRELAAALSGRKQAPATDQKKGLRAYIEELKYAQATGGEKAAMNTAGRDVLYGYEYYVLGGYGSAALHFRQAVAKAPNDPYANYLLGISLIAQGGKEGESYLEKAYRGDPSLKAQAASDRAAALVLYRKKEEEKKPKPVMANKNSYGGPLAYGSYVCTETVWNGSGAATPYSYVNKGSFELKPNGTYRWLDNGATGKYQYDVKSGKITWLTGHLAGQKLKASLFQPGQKVAQLTLQFSDSYRWECGCHKK
ncbi:MAG TPA: hypothetical protein VHK91_06335 [Flavisolibacter sp.]|jgi:hypothetical protein|nr:hypothetical protein [Flavisolibacter sp.]